MNEVGINNEWNALRLKAAYLREKCAEEVELYMHLTTCEGPNLKADYMLRLGQFEHRVFQLKTEVSRWQRRFTLKQCALNQGKKPDLVAIELELDSEFAAYIQQIKEHLRTLQEASKQAASEKLSLEETNAIRMNYLGAVKRLHPDINPDLSAEAVELWHKIQSAYTEGNWKELEFLVGIVDDVLKGKSTVPKSVGSMEELSKRIEQLKAKYEALQERRKKLEQEEPFIWRKLLQNDEDVAKRRAELELEDIAAEYERLWNEKGAGK